VDDAVLLEKDGAVARLVLNRPDRHNALRFDDLDDLVELLHQAEEDDDVKVIILKGRGRSFCSGHDYNDGVTAPATEVAVRHATAVAATTKPVRRRRFTVSLLI
jgi:enoyl-CoA hydratase